MKASEVPREWKTALMQSIFIGKGNQREPENCGNYMQEYQQID
jgi:hypothetical protein